MEKILEKLKKKENLTFEESKSAFNLLMTGKANEEEIYNFLNLLSNKGEVSDEIAGGVYVLRQKSKE
jgi:anthranilate phosphoribosyltransferase